ncbi:MAG: GDP-mannose 4,6-dehydratase [Actinobacteria bacterium]|nr:GDP-mannose 4,6-dehydratase [Actinomycetota bacterium]
MNDNVAFITGISGQAGSYLAELLLSKGYEVHGLMRRTSQVTQGNIAHLVDHPRVHLHYGDVTDLSSLLRVVDTLKQRRPRVLEVYNLAAQSHVHVSFETPVSTAHTDAIGALNVLESLRMHGLHHARVVQASTSEMFGASPPPQSEATPFHPRSPYGVSKVFAYWITKNYREAYGMFTCNSIAFNHESERRGRDFVTRKITTGIAAIAAGDPTPIELGNLDAGRDWAHASDVVRAMWLMLQADAPDDYVVATGHLHTVRQFVEAAFEEAGMPVDWRGAGVQETAVRRDTGAVVVVVNPALYRPAEVDALRGDATRLRDRTGWHPTVSFRQLVKRMVLHDCSGAEA